jgi:translation elongation factor EF-1beta
MKKLIFISAVFLLLAACDQDISKTDKEVFEDDYDFELTEIENDDENEILSDSDENIEFCGPDLTKEEWETEEWKNADKDKDGIPNGYECQECPCADFDGDSFPNYMDEDSDSDGLHDSIECPEYTKENGCRNSDGDRWPDYFDRDSDNDGIPDKYEKEEYGTDPYKKDTDGDGDDDLTEIVCNETDPLDAEDHSTFPTICSSGCYLGNDVKRAVSFNTAPKEQTDITFLIDATSSMEVYIENVKSEITELINEKLSQINEETEDLSYGLIELPYNVILPQTKDVEIFKTKVSEHGSEESWELHLETIYQSLVGDGFEGKLSFFGSPFVEDIDFPEKNCEGALGNIGGACFRENVNHILIVLSDGNILEILEEEGTSAYAWKKGYDEVHNLDDVIAAVLGSNSKLVRISSISSLNDVEYSLLEETGSQTDAGDLLYFDSINPENGKLSDDVVAAINSLLEYEKTDLKMDLILPDTFDKYSVDCEMDVSFKALRADPEEGVDKMDETTFYGVKKGTEITYEISFNSIRCYNFDWYENNLIKTYYLYPQLKSDNKVIATEIIQVKIFPVKCE